MTAELKPSVQEDGHQDLWQVSTATAWYVLFEVQGWDTEFVPFSQRASGYHHRDATACAELREVIGQQEMKKTAGLLKNCLCYSVQIDGSADKQQVDSKFITARLVPPKAVSISSVFLWISSSDLGGADGLLDSFISCVKSVGVERKTSWGNN